MQIEKNTVKWLLNPLMPGDNKKGHTYFNKPAQRSAAGLFKYV